MSIVRKVKVHTCFQLEKGAAPDKPLSPKKCRCRQFISEHIAASEVKRGLAQYVIQEERNILVEEICPVCAAGDLMRSCANCNRSGKVVTEKLVQIPGVDIIRGISPDGKRNTKTVQVKKAPTLEKAHLQRLAQGNPHEQKRTDAYGELNREVLVSLGAALIQVDRRTGIRTTLIEGKPEPPDNKQLRTGRKYDFGRSI